MSDGMPDHYSVDLVENDEGWWIGRCHCGWGGAPYPSAEDAADGLMDHAYEAGVADGHRAYQTAVAEGMARKGD